MQINGNYFVYFDFFNNSNTLKKTSFRKKAQCLCKYFYTILEN